MAAMRGTNGVRGGRAWLGLGLVLCGVRGVLGAAADHPLAGPFTARLHPELRVELVAQEPDVVDPVALTFDADGRMYVVEMRDYPYGFGPDRKGGGTIRLLEDRNGDGRMDFSRVFAEGLSYPTSIAPWKGGVIVAAPPQIIFLRDSDGDGIAEEREVLLEGFELGVTDSNVNGLRWGLDNRLHGLNGGNGGTIRSLRSGGAAVPIRNLDFSFDPGTGDFAPTTTTSGGFGLVFDEWGRSFCTYNIDHIQHRVMPIRYLRRFPGLPMMATTENISDHGAMARIYPVSVAATRPNHPEQAGHFSAAGGMGYAGAGLFSGDLVGSVFVCDVVGNLVHRDRIVTEGPVFKATRFPGEEEAEFFASKDPAFRPVGLETGPEGALYLIDMQRDVIEHPDYIPKKLLERLDLRAGEDRGRIYRLVPKGHRHKAFKPMSKQGPKDWVRSLASEHRWVRDTAQRLLVERGDASVVEVLGKVAVEGRNPLARLHALWTLQGLGKLTEPVVLAGLQSDHAGLVENALVLAEPFLGGSRRLQQAVLDLPGDARVRFQKALALGFVPRAEASRVLLSILLEDRAHRWSRVAVLSSVAEDGAAFASASMVSLISGTPGPLLAEIYQQLAEFAAGRLKTEPAALQSILEVIQREAVPEPARLAALSGLTAGVQRFETIPPQEPSVRGALDRLGVGPSPARLLHVALLRRALGLGAGQAERAAIDAAVGLVKHSATAPGPLLEHLPLLRVAPASVAVPALLDVFDGKRPGEVQSVALETLRAFAEESVGAGLVARWRLLGPGLRGPAINLILSRTSFHGALLEAVEKGQLTVGELGLDLEQRRRLLRHSTAAIMERAARWFTDEEYGNRKGAVESWLSRLPASGDVGRGKAAFEKACASCHSAHGVGIAVGPELTNLGHRSVEDLLSNILDPNMALNPAYVSYQAELEGDELETGILLRESSETVSLKQAGGRVVEIPRKRIRSLKSAGLSLMPEGLEAGLTPEELRDIIAFVQAERLPGAAPARSAR